MPLAEGSADFRLGCLPGSSQASGRDTDRYGRMQVRLGDDGRVWCAAPAASARGPGPGNGDRRRLPGDYGAGYRDGNTASRPTTAPREPPSELTHRNERGW